MSRKLTLPKYDVILVEQGDDHGWYCSEVCASSADGVAHLATDEGCAGLVCERCGRQLDPPAAGRVRVSVRFELDVDIDTYADHVQPGQPFTSELDATQTLLDSTIDHLLDLPWDVPAAIVYATADMGDDW